MARKEGWGRGCVDVFVVPAGFWPRGQTRGGTVGFPACIHIRNLKCKKVSTVSKFVVCEKISI